jgi:hypothetical protein
MGIPEEYKEALFRAFENSGGQSLPKTLDLCCYWFDLGRRAVATGNGVRVGLLATQGIRGPSNRPVLDAIRSTCHIFEAWSDREWILDGAHVQVSIVCFADTREPARLDGQGVPEIFSNLTSDIDLTTAVRLESNKPISFMGDTKGGAFELPFDEARAVLGQPNPNGRGNVDVIRRWINGDELTDRPLGTFIIDFGCETEKADAAGYERPFAIVADRVKPRRDENARDSYRDRWWIHAEPRPDMRDSLPRTRFLVTPNLTKYRFFVFLDGDFIPDHQLIAFARDDYYFLGVLHSSIHEAWARRQGSQLREAASGFRYIPTQCFDTFPLPWPPGKEDVKHPAYQRIAAAAKALDEQRERWLNPPEWVEPIERRIDEQDDFSDVPPEARPLVRRSAIMAAAARDARLKKRTLTNLYNDRPTWLRLAHQQLDRAVLAAYAAADPDGKWDESWSDVWLDTGAGQPLPADHPLYARRAGVDRQVLANLLRLNHERAGAQEEGRPQPDTASKRATRKRAGSVESE